MICFLDALSFPRVGDVVDAPLDVAQLAGRQDALHPLDVEGVLVLQARLLFDDGELFDHSSFNAMIPNAEMQA